MKDIFKLINCEKIRKEEQLKIKELLEPSDEEKRLVKLSEDELLDELLSDLKNQPVIDVPETNVVDFEIERQQKLEDDAITAWYIETYGCLPFWCK